MRLLPILAAMLVLLVCSPFPVRAGGAKVEVAQTVHDFGVVMQGKKVEQVFTFRNAGDEPLLIHDVRSSCGCTAALLSSSSIPPGGGGELRAIFDSTRFSGQIHKTISLATNDPLQPQLLFTLQGVVRPEFQTSPSLVQLGAVKIGTTKNLSVEIANRGEGTVAFGAIKFLAPDLSGELSATTLASGETVTLKLHSTPTAGRTSLGGYVVIPTDSLQTPELRIPVYGSARAD